MYCFLPAFADSSLKIVGELLEVVVARFSHFVEHVRIGVLGRDLQPSADVVPDQFSHVLGRAASQVHADAAGDQHFFDARRLPRLFHQLDQRAVIGTQQLADRRVHARLPPADRLDFRTQALHLIHVRGRSADVADDA